MRRIKTSDAKKQATEIQRLADELSKKRRVKVHSVRARKGRPLLSPIGVADIPITVQRCPPEAWFPASLSDLRAILTRIGPGIADGLAGVTLCLGEKNQLDRLDDMEAEIERDPYTGRVGKETLPGVYRPRVLGTYFPGQAKIQLTAYVGEPALPGRPMWELYLRLHMLMTFAHEVAHHWDFAARIARGRWRADSRPHVEVYAEGREHDWTRQVVIPYLQEAYPEAWKQLRAWMREKIGVELPMPILAGDTRVTCRDGMFFTERAFYNTASDFEDFVRDVANGKDLGQTRVKFARDLHYSCVYDLALIILGEVLKTDSSNLEAITLRADVLEHQEKYEEALQIVMGVLAIELCHDDAMRIAALCYEGLKRWQDLRNMAGRLIQQEKQTGLSIRLHFTACVELGDFAAAEADIRTLEGEKCPKGYLISRLRKILQERLDHRANYL